MRPTTILASANANDHLLDVLAHIQKFSARSSAGGSTNKHQEIRVTHWLRKLRSQPTSNDTWLKNVLEHAMVLLQMLSDGVLEEPFTKMPPQGPLATLPRHKVARVTKPSKLLVKAPLARRSSRVDNNNPVKSKRNEPMTQLVSKQSQTQEQDDQWEWQRVWKGAFEKMRQQLEEKEAETRALTAANKELLVLVAGHEKSLEDAERERRDVETKHLAELENLRAVHSLELADLQARHRQKLQDITLHNDEQLLRTRREARCKRLTAKPLIRTDTVVASADAHVDFLAYIDDFYAATRALTSQNNP